MFTSAHRSTLKLILICKAYLICYLAKLLTPIFVTCLHILSNMLEKLAWVLMSACKLNVLILGSQVCFLTLI